MSRYFSGTLRSSADVFILQKQLRCSECSGRVRRFKKFIPDRRLEIFVLDNIVDWAMRFLIVSYGIKSGDADAAPLDRWAAR